MVLPGNTPKTKVTPNKNGIDNFHGKHLFVNYKLWSNYKKKTGDNISYKEFRAIIQESMDEIRKWVLREPIGFQLDKKIGNITVNKFAPKAEYKAFLHTSLGKVLNHNLHTGGAMFRIQWFHSHVRHDSRQPYWFFKASRKFNRSLAATLKSGKGPVFNAYMQRHFIAPKNG